MFFRNKKNLFFYFALGCVFWRIFSLHLFEKSEHPALKSRVSSEDKATLSKILSKIPKDDQLILEDFFHDLVTQSLFGYVLFGNKPLSDASCINPLSDFYFRFRMEPENLKFYKGIICWRKHYNLFPSKDYLFIFFEDPTKDDYIKIALVNKKAYLKIIQKNLIKFQTVLGPNMTAEKLLVKFVTDQDFWENPFDYETLGILFGYGESNSYLFQRREDINPQPCCRRFTLKKRPKIPRQGYATIEEEYADLRIQLQPLEDDISFDREYMDLPRFAAIANSEETIRIKNDFIQTRKKMIKIFRDGEFFKKSMQRYTGLESD